MANAQHPSSTLYHIHPTVMSDSDDDAPSVAREGLDQFNIAGNYYDHSNTSNQLGGECRADKYSHPFEF